jgi:hypothetical protein
MKHVYEVPASDQKIRRELDSTKEKVKELYVDTMELNVATADQTFFDERVAKKTDSLGIEELLELDEKRLRQFNIEPDPRRAPLKLLVNDRISQIVRENEVFKDKL